MPIVIKTWTWLNNADGWTFTPGFSGQTGGWNGEGNPAGAVYADLSIKNRAGQGSWEITGTWESIFGIPVESTVTQVRLYGVDTRCTAFLYVDYARYSQTWISNTAAVCVWLPPLITPLWDGRQAVGVEGSWTSTPSGSNFDVPEIQQPSDSLIGFRLYDGLDTANTVGATVRLYWDNLAIEITYEEEMSSSSSSPSSSSLSSSLSSGSSSSLSSFSSSSSLTSSSSTGIVDHPKSSYVVSVGPISVTIEKVS